MHPGIWISAAIGAFFIAWFLIEKGRRKSHPVTGGLDQTREVQHEQELELYSNSFSHCSRKARLVLAELGIAAKHHKIDLIETGWYETISPDYLKVNSSGLVPTLVHQGHPVFESDEILSYAQLIAGPAAPNLVPTQAAAKQRMENWLQFCSISSDDALAAMETEAGACIPGLTLPLFATSIRYIPFRNILVGFLFHPDKRRPTLFSALKLFGLKRVMKQRPIQKIMLASRDHMRRHLEYMNTELTNHNSEWILGDAYSLADVSIGCLLLRLEETRWLDYFAQTSEISAVTTYFARIKQRSAWTQAITECAHPIIEKAERDLADSVAADPELRRSLYGGSIAGASQ